MADVNTNTSSRDVTIEQLKLIGSNGETFPIDQGGFVDIINIYEDLFMPVITGTIQITDGAGIFPMLSMHGNEYLLITFTRPAEGSGIPEQKYTKTFRIYKCENKRPYEKNQAQRYVLHFCSEELVFSNQTTLSRKLKSGSATDHVLRICRTDLKVNRKKMTPSNFERSLGQTELMLTQYKPLDAIQYLCSRAYNSNESTFLFFENKDGFNFLSIENLIKRESIIPLQYSTAKITQDQKTSAFANYNAVIDFNYSKVFDVLEGTKGTAHNGRLFTLDLITQKYQKYDYSYYNEYNRRMLMDSNNIAGKVSFPFNDARNRNNKTLYEEYAGSINYCLTNKGQGNLQYFQDRAVRSVDTNIERTLLQRKAQLNLLRSAEVECVVPGNPGLTVGRMVEFQLPAFMKENDNKRMTDPYLSGKYIITALCHTIVGSTLQTRLTLSKNSVNDNLDSFNANSENFRKARDY